MKKTVSILMSLGLATAMLAITADESFARSRSSKCRMYARHEANRVANEDVGNGALLGAGAGGLYGGVTGGGAGSNIITGLVGGAIGGAVIGGISGNSKKQQVYRMAYEDCMGY
jgi:uncharacterized protein YcfJ